MPDDEGLSNEGAGPRSTDGSLDVCIRIEPGHTFAGSIRVAGRSTELTFSGLIEFMSLINALKDGADHLSEIADNDRE